MASIRSSRNLDKNLSPQQFKVNTLMSVTSFSSSILNESHMDLTITHKRTNSEKTY